MHQERINDCMIFEDIYKDFPFILSGNTTTLRLIKISDPGMVLFTFRIRFFIPGNTTPPVTRFQTEFSLQARNGCITLNLKELLDSARDYIYVNNYFPQLIISARIGEDTASWSKYVMSGKCNPVDCSKLQSSGYWWTRRPQKADTYIHGSEELYAFIPQINPGDQEYKLFVTVYFRFLLPHSFLLFNWIPGGHTIYRNMMSEDCSYRRIRELADREVFDDEILAYDIYFEGYESQAQRFIVNKDKRVKEFRFRNSLGVYDCIYASGTQSTEVDAKVSTFLNSMAENELSNTSKMYFSSDSGYLDTNEKIAFWKDFVASDDRYVLGDDSRWHQIIVDDVDFKAESYQLNSIKFKWHYSEEVVSCLVERTIMQPYIKRGI